MNDLPPSRRLVERWLFKCRGHPPVVAERLVCGHVLMKKVAAHWVRDEKFPTPAPIDRLCKACAEKQPPMSWNPAEVGSIVRYEKFDLLTLMAKAAAGK